MKVSNKGLELIKKFEGCRLKAYLDPVGIPTIGYGHTKNVKMGDSITQKQADDYLREDCVKAENAVNKYLNKYRFNQNQFDALVSFAYNIGSIDQLTAKGTRTLAKISQTIPAYCNAGGKKLQGLVNRRNAEKDLFDSVAIEEAVIIPYEVGKIYSLQSDKAVKVEPNINSVDVPYASLTANAKKHTVKNSSILAKGTRITCKDVFVNDSNVWVKCPSGWIEAINGSEVYIK